MTSLKEKLYRAVSFTALVAVMVIIFCLSHENATDSKETSIAVTSWLSRLFGDIPDGLVRTIAHGCEYAGLGFLMHNALYSVKKSIPQYVSIAIAFLYAISDEIHQLFVPGRAFQLTDLLVDLTGILIGTATITILLKLISRSQKNDCDSK